MQWRPYQKARYISQLVEGNDFTFAQIARIIGSRAPTVREHYIAYTLVRQSRDQMAIDTSFAEQVFGVLRRSLSDPNIRRFISLELDKSEKELAKPVPRSRADKVKEFFEWAFGTEERKPVLRESRELKSSASSWRTLGRSTYCAPATTWTMRSRYLAAKNESYWKT